MTKPDMLAQIVSEQAATQRRLERAIESALEPVAVAGFIGRFTTHLTLRDGKPTISVKLDPVPTDRNR